MTQDAHKLDRRSFDRFAIERELTYTFISKTNGDAAGTGKTVNMSSKGILFTTDHMLLPGDGLAVTINWHAAQNQKPVKLFAHGRIIGRHDGAVSMEIVKFEFRNSDN